MEEKEDSPQLKGIVIIRLPPPENPSLGKTITAIAFNENTQSQTRQAPEAHHQVEPLGPLQPSQSQEESPGVQERFSFKRLTFGSPLVLSGILIISLIALFSWVSSNQETLYELRDADHEGKSNSIIFPLYHKFGIGGIVVQDAELKLRRFPDFKSKTVLDTTSGSKSAESVIAESKIDSSTILPVSGNIHQEGLYYTFMLVGNPPKPYFLDIDTGSDLTWIQCDAPCTSCAKGAHPFYKPNKSNLIDSRDSYCIEVQKPEGNKCKKCDQCDYEIEYADSSSSIGVLTKDKFHLMISNGSMVKPNLVFGCAYDQQGILLKSLAKTDGILGLSQGKISLPSQLASHGNIKNVVAHCLAPGAGVGGYVFLGNDFVPHQQMVWIPMLNSPFMNSYRAEVTKISYGGKQLSSGGTGDGFGSAIFDSGSSYTYFTKEAYNDLVASFQDISAKGLLLDASDDTFPICWRAKFPIRSIAQLKQYFKPLEFHFGSKWWIVSKKLHIPPEGYLITSNRGNICLGILEGSHIDDGSTVILGDISLRGKLFVYDNEDQKIGWIKSDCARPRMFDRLAIS